MRIFSEENLHKLEKRKAADGRSMNVEKFLTWRGSTTAELEGVGSNPGQGRIIFFSFPTFLFQFYVDKAN